MSNIQWYVALSLSFIGVVMSTLILVSDSASTKAEEPMRHMQLKCLTGQSVHFRAPKCKPHNLGGGKWVYFVNDGIYDLSMCTCFPNGMME